MPVEFLSDDQAARYGHYSRAADGRPTRPLLLPLRRGPGSVVDERRTATCRLGFAVQLGTVRFLGTFLSDLTEVPPVVVRTVGDEPRGRGPEAAFARYLSRDETRREHAAEIQDRYGYRPLTDPSESFRLTRWLYARAWLASERPSVLFDLATARLVERKVLLPGVTTLARLVARVRGRAADRLYDALARLPTDEQREQLEALLVVPEGDRVSRLERLRRAPVRVSGPALVLALSRVEQTRALGDLRAALDTSGVPSARRDALARYAASAWVPTIARMPTARRTATLVAFAEHVQRPALDDALDLFGLARRRALPARRAGREARAAPAAPGVRPGCAPSPRPRSACSSTVSSPTPVSARPSSTASGEPSSRKPPRRSPRSRASRATGSTTRSSPAGGPSGGSCRRSWRRSPSRVHGRPRPVLDAVGFLRELEEPSRAARDGRGSARRPHARVGAAHARRRVSPARKPYTFGVLDELLGALRRRDVFVPGSGRWDDPRAKLLQGERWEAARPSVCRALGRAPSPDDELAALQTELDEAYRRTAANLDSNEAVRVEQTAGRDRLVVTPLDKLDEPESLVQLRAAVQARMPRVELPELLLEVEAWTGFTGAFTHASEGRARASGLDVSLCAALLSEACNVGLRPFSQAGTPALTTRRLSWVLQNYVRAETLVAANARLVDYQATIPLAQAWGGGEVASADGLRFVVPVRTLNAGPNPKYFGVGQGVTYYNFTSDQFTGFHAVVVPGTLRDSLYVLAGLLEQQTGLEPDRGRDRHGGLQRHGLWAVLAPRLPVQPAAGRPRRRAALADGPRGRLRAARRRRAPARADGAHPGQLGRPAPGRGLAQDRRRRARTR